MLILICVASSLVQISVLWLIWKLSDRASYKAKDAADSLEMAQEALWRMEQRIVTIEKEMKAKK